MKSASFIILGEVGDALRNAGSGVTNIEAVLAVTRFSPQDVANAFGHSRSLVIALVEQTARSMLEPLADDRPATSFQQRLLEFGQRVAQEYSSPQVRCLYRIVLTEVIRNTGIGLDFYKHGPGFVTAGLARFFEATQSSCISSQADCRQLAGHFMALLRAELGDSELARACGARGDISRIVKLFCEGIGGEVEYAHAAV